MLLSHTTFVKWMSRNKNSERAKETAAKTPPQRNTLCSSSSMSKREKKNDYIKAIAASALIRTHKHTEENEGEWKKKKTGRVLEKGREMQKKDLVSLMTIRTAARATKKKGKKSCYCTHAKKKKTTNALPTPFPTTRHVSGAADRKFEKKRIRNRGT